MSRVAHVQHASSIVPKIYFVALCGSLRDTGFYKELAVI